MYVPEANITVSISIITYNQEQYIAKAIESVLMQEVDFNYEIIIGDDCSSDRTPEILKEYQHNYPDRIHLILHPRRYDNIPGRINNITNLYACRGKYIAMLDGDDYWISTDKLQKQIGFLNNNPDFSLCFHDAEIISDNDNFKSYRQSDKHDFTTHVFDQQDLLERWNFIPTSSALFRNHFTGEFPEWFWKIYGADYAIHLMIAHFGKIKYCKKLECAKRENGTSFTATYPNTPDYFLERIEELKIFQDNFPLSPSAEIKFKKRLSRYFLHHAFYLYSKGKPLGFSRYGIKSIRQNKLAIKMIIARILGIKN